MARKTKPHYYSLDAIKAEHAHYNLIIGERSNGKTFAVLSEIVKNYYETGKQGAYIRRMSEDFTGKRGATLFEALIDSNGKNTISELTQGYWTSVYYYGSRWYLCNYVQKDNGEWDRESDETPFCYGFALTATEHEKGVGYPNITTICFDEFMTRHGYLRDEFVLFMNTLSTIIRQRDDVTIYMCGNTVNKYCPYFKEMGLRHIDKMKQGTIDVYAINHEYGEQLRIAVEYCKPNTKGKKSDFYFSFDNDKLKMITRGMWEIDIYPHCPVRYKPRNVLFTYFIEFEETLLQCEVVQVDDMCFTYIHLKTTPLKYPDTELIYSTKHSPKPNWRRRITNPSTLIEKRVYQFFMREKVFYQDNEIGEVVRNYLQWCRQ